MADEDLRWTDDKNVRSFAQMKEYTSFADRIAEDFPGADVLDWGCAFGQMSDLLIKRGMSVTAFDYDPEIGEDQRALPYYPHITVRYTADPVGLPFPNDSFDTVLSSGVLEHVRDPDGSLVEIARVLKPGGTLYVYKLPNETSWLEWIAKRIGMFYHGMHEDDRLYTIPKARQLMRNNGYRVQEIRMANMLPLSMFVGPVGRIIAEPVWWLNRFLARLPLVRKLATNVELVAVPTGLFPTERSAAVEAA